MPHAVFALHGKVNMTSVGRDSGKGTTFPATGAVAGPPRDCGPHPDEDAAAPTLPAGHLAAPGGPAAGGRGHDAPAGQIKNEYVVVVKVVYV
eukprot:scaffold238870_cov37-Prasinocladus_malaysianus.AAC.1